MATDRLSALDDNLLCSHILSKLSLPHAIRCSLLSRRWRYLWIVLPHIKISSPCFKGKVLDHMMLFHSGPLESFELSFTDSYGIDNNTNAKLFWRWLCFASAKKFKEITLKNCFNSFTLSLMYLPTSLFSCDCLTFLKLEYFDFREIPAYSFGGFKCLRTCFLSRLHTTDAILDYLVTRCPLLENLTVQNCNGLNNTKISAVNLKKLAFTDNNRPSSLTLNCPQLMHIEVQGFHPISRLELNCCGSLHLSTAQIHLLEGISNRNLLRKLTLRRFSRYLSSLTVLNSFPNLEELFIENISPSEDFFSISHLEGLSFEELLQESFSFFTPEELSMQVNSFSNLEEPSMENEHLKKQGTNLVGSSSTLSLKNLKKVNFMVSRFNGEEIALLSSLLRSAPLLHKMTVILPGCCQHIYVQRFVKHFVDLKRLYEEVSIIIIEKHDKDCGDVCLKMPDGKQNSLREIYPNSFEE